MQRSESGNCVTAQALSTGQLPAGARPVAHIEWLKTIASLTSDYMLGTMPFTAGAFWWREHACATDGHLFLALEAERGDLPAGESTKFAPLESLLFATFPADIYRETVPLSALRAWCEPKSAPEACETCNGTRLMPCVECADHKEHEPETYSPKGCEACGGTEQEKCWDCPDIKSRPAAIASLVVKRGNVKRGDRRKTYTVTEDVLIDRRLLGLLLAHAPGESVTFYAASKESAVRFEGEGWRALLMPMRRNTHCRTKSANRSAL